MSTFIREAWPRAAKTYRCSLCDLTIEVGERHEAQTLAWEGSIYTARTHLACASRYWDYWRWTGWTARDGDPSGETVDPDDFRTFLAEKVKAA